MTDTTTIRLRRLGAGQYQTADGRFTVESDYNVLPGECECVVCQQGSSAYCRNQGASVERGWIVWDDELGDYARGTGPLYFRTKRQAVEWLSANVAELLATPIRPFYPAKETTS